MKYTIFFLLLSSFSFANNPELIIRADKYTPHVLPTWSKMPSTSPACNNHGISTKYLSFFGDERLHPAMMHLQQGKPSFSKPFANDISVSELFLTPNNTSIFALNYRGGTEGIYELDNNSELKQLILPKDFNNTLAMSRPSLVEGKVLFRSLNKDGLHTIYHGKNILLDEVKDIAYLYLPTSKDNQIVLKIGLGSPGEVNQNNKDKIVSIKNEISTTIAEDKDLNPQSAFLRFDNSPIPDGDGGAVFIAEHEIHGRSLWRNKGNTNTLIVSEKSFNIKLEYFSPDINNHGDIVFRAIQNGLRHVFAWNSQTQEVSPLLSQGQVLPSNEDDIQVINREKWPAFSGKPCITNNREAFIHTVLQSSKTLENKGSGIFKVKL